MQITEEVQALFNSTSKDPEAEGHLAWSRNTKAKLTEQTEKGGVRKAVGQWKDVVLWL